MMSSSANGPCISPLLTCSAMAPIAEGSRATMPARMIIEMPLPMPRSVICSPSHIRNMVPVVMVTVATSRNCGPLTSVMPPLTSAPAAANDCTTARMSEP